MDVVVAHQVKQRHHLGNHGSLPPIMIRKRRVACADIPAGNRGIDEMKLATPDGMPKQLCQLRSGGGHVDQNRSWLGPYKQTFGPK